MNTTLTVAGNLTRDPELRYTAIGKAVVTLGLAITPRRAQRPPTWPRKRRSTSAHSSIRAISTEEALPAREGGERAGLGRAT